MSALGGIGAALGAVDRATRAQDVRDAALLPTPREPRPRDTRDTRAPRAPQGAESRPRPARARDAEGPRAGRPRDAAPTREARGAEGARGTDAARERGEGIEERDESARADETTAPTFAAMLAMLAPEPGVAPVPSAGPVDGVIGGTEEAVHGGEVVPTEDPVFETRPGLRAPSAPKAPVLDGLHYGLRTDGTLPSGAPDGGPRGAWAPRLVGTPRAHGPMTDESTAPADAVETLGTAPDAPATAVAPTPAAPITAAVTAPVGRDLEASLPATSPTPDDVAEAPGAPADVASPAERAVGSAATATSAAPATRGTALRDVAALDPELRTKLARVAQRMRDEFGHDVEVVETVRSQARQEALFAQGRSAPGPVVTWTRASKHLDGRAVDVKIDGGWSDARAFQRLQRIAAEEGLRTLGARDPGHLELAGPSGAARADRTGARMGADALAAALEAQSATAAELAAGLRAEDLPGVRTARVERAAPVAPAASPSHVAAVAPVAQVAPTAQVAQVAQVAAVAVPGAVAAPRPVREHGGSLATRGVPADGKSADATIADATGDAKGDAKSGARDLTASFRQASADARGAQDGATRGHRDGRGGADRGQSPDTRIGARATRTVAAAPRAEGDAAAAMTASAPNAAPGAAPVEAPRGVAAPVGLGALARVQAAQDAADVARPLSRLTLQLDGAAGVERVRLDLRGLQLAAGLTATDAAAADRLAAGIGDLRAALARHGLQADTVEIGGRALAESRLDAARAADRATEATGDRALERLAALGGASASSDAGNASSNGQSSQGSNERAFGAREQQQRDAAPDQQGRRDRAEAHRDETARQRDRRARREQDQYPG